MQFIPTNEYREISLQEGLNQVQSGNTDKLFSDGLDENEYIYFDHNKGFGYEDGIVVFAYEKYNIPKRVIININSIIMSETYIEVAS